MPKFYLAIQGAASTGTIAVCDPEGKILKAVGTPPLMIRINSHIDEDLDFAIDNLHKYFELTRKEFFQMTEGVCVSMPGAYQKVDELAVKHLLRGLSIVGHFDPIICEDVWSILSANAKNEGGVVLVSTGSNVFIRNAEGKSVSIGGWGSELADLGSGFYIGKLTMNALLDMEDGRRPCSIKLRNAVLDSLDLDEVSQLVPWYYATRKTNRWRSAISDIAIVVDGLADVENDKYALRILNQASDEIIFSIKRAIRQAQKEGLISKTSKLEMILCGGLLLNSTFYHSKIESLSRKLSPKASTFFSKLFPKQMARETDDDFELACLSFEDLKHHPIVGSLAFALSGSLKLCTQQQYSKLLESANALGLN